VERVTLWELSPDGGVALLRHVHDRAGTEAPPEDIIPAVQFEWLMQQNRKEQIVVWRRMPEDIPAAAVGEREYASRIGAKSLLSIPVYTHSVLCALAFTSFEKYQAWPQALIDRLQLVSTIFAAAVVRQRLDTSLRASEARNRAILKALPDIMLVITPDGTYLDYYCRDESRLLVPPEKFIGARVTDFFPPEMCGPVCDALRRAAQTDELVEFDFAFTFNGRQRVHESRMIRRDDGAIVCLVRDISERSRMLRELCESEERFRGAFENSAIGMAIVGPDGQWLRSNAANCRMLGYSEAQLRDMSFASLTHPEDLALNIEQYRRALAGEIDHYEMKKRYIHKDGHIVHCYLTVSVVRDEQRAPLYFVSQLQDRTDAVKARSEIERLRSELTHSGRVALMGQLTASLAHQLMQPIAAVQANAEACQRMLAEPRPVLAHARRALQDIVSSCTRAAYIVDNVKSLLRKQPAVRREVSVNALLKEMLEVVRYDLIARHVKLVTRFDRSEPRVLANPIELQQVFLNLVLNAAEAVERQAGAREIVVGTQRRPEERAEVFVHDSGPGVPESDLKRIFEPFFTTKDGGMGMGLAICREIVHAHLGRIAAAPGPKGGFRVWCSFPCSDGTAGVHSPEH
jgi:PAS domain S-box-containing protein